MAGRGLAQELACIKYAVVSLKIRMAVNLPSRFDAGPVSDKAALARIACDQQEARNGIDTVVQVFSPLRDKSIDSETLCGNCIWSLG